MAKKKTTKKPRLKPGPREERLIITGNPQTALDKLLGKKTR